MKSLSGTYRNACPGLDVIAVRDFVKPANCINIERLDMRSDPNGVTEVRALRRTDRNGIQMPPLDMFRRIMAEVTDEAYPEGGEWGEYQLPMTEATYSVDPNGGDADEVERLAALNRKGEPPIPF